MLCSSITLDEGIKVGGSNDIDEVLHLFCSCIHDIVCFHLTLVLIAIISEIF